MHKYALRTVKLSLEELGPRLILPGCHPSRRPVGQAGQSRWRAPLGRWVRQWIETWTTHILASEPEWPPSLSSLPKPMTKDRFESVTSPGPGPAAGHAFRCSAPAVTGRLGRLGRNGRIIHHQRRNVCYLSLAGRFSEPSSKIYTARCKAAVLCDHGKRRIGRHPSQQNI